MSRRPFAQALWPGLWLAGLLAVLAFALSFLALRSVGVASGVDPTLAWMFPVIIDGFIVLATWATWRFRAHGLRAAWYPAGALVVFSAVSLTGNALHAHPVPVGDLLLARWAAAAFSGVPPVALLAASHMLVMIATHRRRAGESAVDVTSPADPDLLEGAGAVWADRGELPQGPVEVFDAPRPVPALVSPVVGGAEGPTQQARLAGASARATTAAAAKAGAVHAVARVASSTDDELARWVRDRVAAGEVISGPGAVAVGLFTAESTARRRLRALREVRPDVFEPVQPEAEAR